MNDGWRMMTNNILVYMYVDCSCSFIQLEFWVTGWCDKYLFLPVMMCKSFPLLYRKPIYRKSLGWLKPLNTAACRKTTNYHNEVTHLIYEKNNWSTYDVIYGHQISSFIINWAILRLLLHQWLCHCFHSTLKKICNQKSEIRNQRSTVSWLNWGHWFLLNGHKQ